MNIPIKLLTKTANIPTRAYEYDAGADIYYDGDSAVTFGPKAGWVRKLISLLSGKKLEDNRKLLSTGIAIAIPEGYVGLIWPRSGLAVKKGFSTMAGVIDSAYRGEVKVLIRNDSNLPQSIEPSDKIAQIIIQKCYNFPFVAVDELPESNRGENGFGSSGS